MGLLKDVDKQEKLTKVFFFECYRDHRNLHSFPTRRSSDLTFMKCGRPAGAGVGGFNGWCEEHFKKVALKVARYLGSQARDVTTKLVIAKLIKVALEHFPHIIMNRSGEPGSVPEEMVRLARLNGEGNTLAIWLHGPK